VVLQKWDYQCNYARPTAAAMLNEQRPGTEVMIFIIIIDKNGEKCDVFAQTTINFCKKSQYLILRKTPIFFA
jgi:hypothetical protein